MLGLWDVLLRLKFNILPVLGERRILTFMLKQCSPKSRCNEATLEIGKKKKKKEET
jgi:hypothetical protein